MGLARQMGYVRWAMNDLADVELGWTLRDRGGEADAMGKVKEERPGKKDLGDGMGKAIHRIHVGD